MAMATTTLCGGSDACISLVNSLSMELVGVPRMGVCHGCRKDSDVFGVVMFLVA